LTRVLLSLSLDEEIRDGESDGEDDDHQAHDGDSCEKRKGTQLDLSFEAREEKEKGGVKKTHRSSTSYSGSSSHEASPRSNPCPS